MCGLMVTPNGWRAKKKCSYRYCDNLWILHDKIQNSLKSIGDHCFSVRLFNISSLPPFVDYFVSSVNENNYFIIIFINFSSNQRCSSIRCFKLNSIFSHEKQKKKLLSTRIAETNFTSYRSKSNGFSRFTFYWC